MKLLDKFAGVLQAGVKKRARNRQSVVNVLNEVHNAGLSDKERFRLALAGSQIGATLAVADAIGDLAAVLLAAAFEAPEPEDFDDDEVPESLPDPKDQN